MFPLDPRLIVFRSKETENKQTWWHHPFPPHWVGFVHNAVTPLPGRVKGEPFGHGLSIPEKKYQSRRHQYKCLHRGTGLQGGWAQLDSTNWHSWNFLPHLKPGFFRIFQVTTNRISIHRFLHVQPLVGQPVSSVFKPESESIKKWGS